MNYNFQLVSLALLSCAVWPAAFAQTSQSQEQTAVVAPAASPVKSAVGPTDWGNFKPKFKAAFSYYLNDSSRKISGDYAFGTARLGLLYNYKNVFSEVVTQAGSSVGQTAQKNNYMTVRKASGGLYFVKSDTNSLSVLIGRDRLITSIMYSPVGLTFLGTNYDNATSAWGEDGISFKYTSKLSFGSLNAGIGYYDTSGIVVQNTGSDMSGGFKVASSPWGGQTLGGADASWSSGSIVGNSRSVIGYVSSDVKIEDGTLQARAMYTTHDNDPVYYSETTTSTCTSLPCTVASTTSKKYFARDAKSFEGSLGYDYKNNALVPGVWIQHVDLGKTRSADAASNKSNDLNFSDVGAKDDQAILTLGLGVTGTSKLFGFSNFISEGDALTYGAGYQYVTGQKYTNTSTTSTSPFTNKEVTFNQWNAAVGYVLENYTASIEYLATAASEQVYLGKDGSSANEKEHGLFFISTTVSM